LRKRWLRESRLTAARIEADQNEKTSFAADQLVPKRQALEKQSWNVGFGSGTFGAVAISLAQRYAKSWTSSLIAQIKRPTDGRELPTPAVATERVDLSGAQDRSGIASKQSKTEEYYPKGVAALFKNATREWMEDKCPQLGAALAYFTVFSLAPLVVVLLAVFGFIFGGNEHARDKITEQLIAVQNNR
jgi:hypothetical protein